jgi:hypothetical protein
VTFKDLKKRVSLETATQQQSNLAERLQNKPFWIWNVEEHRQEYIKTNGECCFNHIIGLPQRAGQYMPMYDYEKIIFDYLVTNSYSIHLWIKKATGLGISEFMLRFMAWLCLKHTKDIEAAIEKGRKYNPDDFTPFYSFTSRSMGIDPAYGSSAFGIVVTQWVDHIVQILYAEEYHRPDYNEMLSTVYSLMSKYDIDMVYVDGANPSFIKSLKLQIGEDPDYC